MDRYTARMNLHGTTQRERAKNRLIAHLNDRTQHRPSHKATADKQARLLGCFVKISRLHFITPWQGRKGCAF